MSGKRKLDAETSRLWAALTSPDIAFRDDRKTQIISAYHFYRQSFGSVTISDAVLRAYLIELFANKGEARGYAVAMHLRDAFRVFWGDETAARVTKLVRAIQTRVPKTLKTDWEAALTPIARLPSAWQELFVEHLEKCKNETLLPNNLLSASTLQSYAEAMCRWSTFRNGDTSRPLTGLELQAFATNLLEANMAASAVRSMASKIYSSYTNIVSPGFCSGACQYVIRDLKGKASAAGSNRKTADQIVSARLIYMTGFKIMNDVMSNPHHNITAAKAYRDGLLLSIASALPLRRRALASLDAATSFRLDDTCAIQIDISGKFLKLRQHRKIVERFRATLVNPRLRRAVDVWMRTIRPIFDDGTSIFPSTLVRGESLVPDALSQIFGDLTHEHFGTRVPIHRVRDCVATECVEEMEHGAAWAQHLLDHKWADTTNRYYVHATGLKAVKEFGELVQRKRSNPTDLLI